VIKSVGLDKTNKGGVKAPYTKKKKARNKNMTNMTSYEILKASIKKVSKKYNDKALKEVITMKYITMI